MSRDATGFAVAAAAAMTSAMAFSHPAQAQAWPTKPVRVISAYAAGGTNELAARPLIQHLSTAFGQQFLLEARPGANGNIGAQEVVRAAPDGYTVLFSTASQLTINPALYKMPFDPMKDLAPIAGVSANSLAIILNAAVPANSFKELIAYARANPGKLTYSSAGNGSINHLSGELLSMLTQTKLLHVPYGGGGPALNAVIAGEVNMIIQSAGGLMLPHLKAGKLKVVGVSSPTRRPLIPDVPTMEELGLPDYKVRSGTMFMGPAAMPRPVINRFNAEVVKYLSSPEGQKQYDQLGVELSYGTPDELGKSLRDELARWTGVVKNANIRLE
jgi:tripartite-type tricarboxylate transporter receptor subunit TctC